MKNKTRKTLLIILSTTGGISFGTGISITILNEIGYTTLPLLQGLLPALGLILIFSPLGFTPSKNNKIIKK